MLESQSDKQSQKNVIKWLELHKSYVSVQRDANDHD